MTFAKTATDQSGNVYALAEGHNAIVLDGVTHPRVGTTMTQVLVKYDSTGQVLWQKRVKISPCGLLDTEGAIQKILVDTAGNVVVMGNARSCGQGQTYLVMDQDTIMRVAAFCYFVVKLTPAGQPIWTRHGGFGQTISAYDMALSPDNDVYLTGFAISTSAPIVFDTISLPIADSWFAARLSGTNGGVRWVRMSRELTHNGARPFDGKIGVNAAGYVYLLATGAGFRIDSLTVGTATADTTMWLKFSPTGRALAGRVVPGGNRYSGHKGFAIDPAGNTYIGAYNNGSDSLAIPPVVGAPPRAYPAGPRVSLMKLDPVGAVEWVKPLPGLGSWILSDMGLAADGAGRLYLGHETGLGGQSLDNYPNTVPGDAFVARLNTNTGRAEALVPIHGVQSEYISSLSASPTGRLAVSGASTSDTTYLGTELVFAHVGRNQSKGFVGQLASDVNLLTGAAFVDANGNNAQDVGENGYPFGNVVALSPGTRQFATNEAGRYAAPVMSGTYSITLASEPLYHTVTTLPPAATTFVGHGQTAPGASFALHPVPGQQDLQVFLTSSAISSIFASPYVHLGLSYRNIGTVPIDSGTVVLAYDTALTYNHSTLMPASTGPGQLTWRFSNLLPGQVQHIGNEFILHAVPPDSLLTSTATITPIAGDLTPGDNAATVAEHVEPDPPMDTTLVSYRQLTRQQVQSGAEWLTYSVRFQNPFADSIYRITLRDSLPDALRRGTVDVVDASHPSAWTLTPEGVLEIRLDGARLAGTNAGSNRAGAYVQFRLRPDVALPVGTRIAHRAQVYLDGQRALTLPEAVTEVVADPLGTATSVAALVGSAWPNPVAGVLHMAVTLPVAGAVTVQLRDATGRLLRHAQQTAARGSWRGQVSTAGLPGGLYLLDMRGGGQRFSRRVVVAGVE